MKINERLTVKEAAKFLDLKYSGDADIQITGINEIHKVEAGDLTFVDIEKYYKKALNSAATIIIINQEVECPEGKALLVSDNPFEAYNKLVVKYKTPEVYESEGAFVSKKATIGKGTKIFPGAYISSGVTIGEDCVIYPNVTIHTDSIIGDRVVIQSNSVIGGDAFYYKNYGTHFEKMISCGRVIIHDGVEIGSLCSIDKGVSGDTIIGKGTILDSQIHIGHGVVIGERCLIVAQVGIGGKAIIEDEVTLLGQVGIPKDVTIGKGATLLSQSGVTKSVEGGKAYLGSPAREAKIAYREVAALKMLPDLIRKMNTK